ncbi:MAG TPA: cytochrome c oxidase subunit II [Acetobacteraceae bacterium]|nr:cytochrome c oxidase subunit II [Acetobacteraceae bacterium]
MQDLRRRGALMVMTMLGALAGVLAGVPAADAQQPTPWEVGLQPGFSPVKLRIETLNTLVSVIIFGIMVLVAGLLLWVMWRYNAKRHPVPSRTSHNTVIEVLWTVVPILLLIIIAIPSFRLVFYENKTHDPYMTVKVTGHQWYWEYAYPAAKGVDFSSYIVPGNKLKPGQPRLLTASAPLVLPVGKDIRILITSGDVIHSFFIPSLGVQRYAIPGQVIETWVRVDKPGMYDGECNQICGTNHSRMPINIEGLPLPQYQAWLKKAQAAAQSASAGGQGGPVQLAAATEIRR